MASYSFYKIPFPISKHQKHYQPTITRSQRFHDEGKWADNSSTNGVDGNMVVLSKRISKERMKERLRKTIWSYESGWNYKSAGYKRRSLWWELVKIANLVGTTISLVFLSGYFFLYLYSLLILP